MPSQQPWRMAHTPFHPHPPHFHQQHFNFLRPFLAKDIQIVFNRLTSILSSDEKKSV